MNFIIRKHKGLKGVITIENTINTFRVYMKPEGLRHNSFVMDGLIINGVDTIDE